MKTARLTRQVIIIFGSLLIFTCNYPMPFTPIENTISQPQETTKDTMRNNQNILPVITLLAGNGYIFSTNSVTVDDRDIWWNAVHLVPANGCKMVLLGKVKDLQNIFEISFLGESQFQFQMFVGDAYGIEILRDKKLQYALIKIKEINKKNTLSFELIYPYIGNVITDRK